MYKQLGSHSAQYGLLVARMKYLAKGCRYHITECLKKNTSLFTQIKALFLRRPESRWLFPWDTQIVYTGHIILISLYVCAGLVEWVERRSRNPNNAGSNPVRQSASRKSEGKVVSDGYSLQQTATGRFNFNAQAYIRRTVIGHFILYFLFFVLVLLIHISIFSCSNVNMNVI